MTALCVRSVPYVYIFCGHICCLDNQRAPGAVLGEERRRGHEPIGRGRQPHRSSSQHIGSCVSAARSSWIESSSPPEHVPAARPRSWNRPVFRRGRLRRHATESGRVIEARFSGNRPLRPRSGTGVRRGPTLSGAGTAPTRYAADRTARQTGSLTFRSISHPGQMPMLLHAQTRLDSNTHRGSLQPWSAEGSKIKNLVEQDRVSPSPPSPSEISTFCRSEGSSW